MKPDYERAASAAAEILVEYGISATPITPLPILKRIPGVLVKTYESLSSDMSQDRRCVIDTFGEQDAFTAVNVHESGLQYIITYNQRLSQTIIQRALSRELGHIVLCHDGSLPEDVRREEAVCFANHLLCPRPLVHAVRSAGITITTDLLGSLTGCYHHCLSCMQRTPATHVPPELNRAIRVNFSDYITDIVSFYRANAGKDTSAPADFGTFMDGYEE